MKEKRQCKWYKISIQKCEKKNSIIICKKIDYKIAAIRRYISKYTYSTPCTTSYIWKRHIKQQAIYNYVNYEFRWNIWTLFKLSICETIKSFKRQQTTQGHGERGKSTKHLFTIGIRRQAHHWQSRVWPYSTERCKSLCICRTGDGRYRIRFAI